MRRGTDSIPDTRSSARIAGIGTDIEFVPIQPSVGVAIGSEAAFFAETTRGERDFTAGPGQCQQGRGADRGLGRAVALPQPRGPGPTAMLSGAVPPLGEQPYVAEVGLRLQRG